MYDGRAVRGDRRQPAVGVLVRRRPAVRSGAAHVDGKGGSCPAPPGPGGPEGRRRATPCSRRSLRSAARPDPIATAARCQCLARWPMSSTCHSCSAEVPSGAKFCGQCGAPQALHCPACGTLTSQPEQTFCLECGAAIPPVAGRRPPPLAAAIVLTPESPGSPEAPRIGLRQSSVFDLPAVERRLVSVLFARPDRVHRLQREPRRGGCAPACDDVLRGGPPDHRRLTAARSASTRATV